MTRKLQTVPRIRNEDTVAPFRRVSSAAPPPRKKGRPSSGPEVPRIDEKFIEQK
jgi:hypothetical protein